MLGGWGFARYEAFFGRAFLVGSLLLLGLVPSASADSTYVYTGNSFTSCSEVQTPDLMTYSDNACPSGPGITGFITLSQALPANAVDYVPNDVLGFSFTAAGVSVDFPDYTTTPFTETNSCSGDCPAGTTPGLGSFTTNSEGDIVGWDINFGASFPVIITTSTEDAWFSPSCSGGGSFQCYNYSNADDPGSWTETPEPSSLLLLGTGLLGLAISTFRFRSRWVHSYPTSARLS